jgi:hypothetical protein
MSRIDDHGPDCACAQCFETLPPSLGDFSLGVAIVIAIAIVLGALALAGQAFAQATNPPVVVRLDRATEARTPAGDYVSLPAGSEISACGAQPWRHDLATRVLHVPQPRRAGPCGLFCDSFERREACP